MTITQEILDKALRDISALACSGTPDIKEIKAGLLKCIVAADCVALDNELILKALTDHARAEVSDFSNRLAASNERVNALLDERERIKALLFSIHTNASEALRDNIETMPLPEYRATGQVRYLCEILRAIGTAAKGVYDSYAAEAYIQETDSHAN